MRSILIVMAALAFVPVARAGETGYRMPAQPAKPVVYAPPAQGSGTPCTAPATCESGCGQTRCWTLGFGLFSRKPTGCGSCPAPAPVKVAPSPSCCHSWHGFARLRAWLAYRDCGECPKGCGCTNHCHTPLYLYFLRDCTYRTGHCCGGHGGLADGAVNPPYAKSVFHAAPMSVMMPTGVGVPH